MSVVDGNLKVYGVDNLRIADASIMPRVTTGNTMAPCVIIGERAAQILDAAHDLSGPKGAFRPGINLTQKRDGYLSKTTNQERE
jgi:choline dehydrogenase-like flavoprotein